jgi:hypothetical protein
VNTGRDTTSELVAEIEKIVLDLSVANHIGVVWPTLRRVLLQLNALDPAPTTAEIERAIDAMMQHARAVGNVLKLRRLRAWCLE